MRFAFAQTRVLAERWLSSDGGEISQVIRWKRIVGKQTVALNDLNVALQGRLADGGVGGGGALIIGWIQFKLAPLMQCVPKTCALISCIHLMRRPQDVFGKRRLKLISFL